MAPVRRSDFLLLVRFLIHGDSETPITGRIGYQKECPTGTTKNCHSFVTVSLGNP